MRLLCLYIKWLGLYTNYSGLLFRCRIYNAQPADSGTYYCTARNNVGVSPQAIVSLVIVGELRISSVAS